MTEKNKPIAKVKQGLIQASIWKNETPNGARYSVTFAKLYKKDDKWKNTTSFGPDDLAALGHVVGLAHNHIFQLTQEG